MTPDERTMFINVQHPGESTTFWNNQLPSRRSRWCHPSPYRSSGAFQ
jgi:secreted PhoX family phosphatase